MKDFLNHGNTLGVYLKYTGMLLKDFKQKRALSLEGITL